MSNTKVDLWNESLSMLGSSVTIEYEADTTDEAQLAGQFYDNRRLRGLARYNWGFAKTQSPPTGLTDTGNPPNGWAFAYKYPAACVKPRKIHTTNPRNPSLPPIPFEEGVNRLGEQEIWTDHASPCILEHTFDQQNVGTFTPEFFDVLAIELSLMMRGPLRGLPITLDEKRALDLMWVQATVLDAAGMQQDDWGDSQGMRARGSESW